MTKTDLSYIVEALRPLAAPIDTIFEDPSNANTHDERSIRAIMASLARYGQRTPLVANRRDHTVEKGNGTLEAARRLGWTHVAVVFVEDDPLTHAGYSIADNRTAQLAAWDEAALRRLLEQVKAGDPEEPASDMWTEVEWDKLFAGAQEAEADEVLADVDFPEYDEDLADEVELVTCPACGHRFPP